MYSDADFAGGVQSRRSTTAYGVMMCGAVVSWSSKLQHNVALSTAEAEYMALSAAVREWLWIRQVLKFLGMDVKQVLCKVYNQATVYLANNPVVGIRSKHIDVQHHFLREHVKSGDIKVIHCGTQNMAVDMLTKPLSRMMFEKGCKAVGMDVCG